jgi:hypothetical protein
MDLKEAMLHVGQRIDVLRSQGDFMPCPTISRIVATILRYDDTG